TVMPPAVLEFTGIFEASGGSVSGLNRVVGSEIRETVPSAAGTLLYLGGTGNTLTTDNLANTALWIRGGLSGTAILTADDSFTNAGTIRMETQAAGFQSSLVVNGGGVLDNLSSGVFQSLAGTGGPRNITGSMRNRGLLEITAATTISGTLLSNSTGALT